MRGILLGVGMSVMGARRLSFVARIAHKGFVISKSIAVFTPIQKKPRSLSAPESSGDIKREPEPYISPHRILREQEEAYRHRFRKALQISSLHSIFSLCAASERCRAA